jgi:FAD:protein FMN transferase
MFEKSPAALTRRRCLALFASAATYPMTASAAPFGRSQPHRWEGTALGGDASILLDGFTPEENALLIERAVAELARLEQIFSLHRSTSALSLLNHNGTLTETPDELLDALEQCRALHLNTGGAFDPSVQRLWEHYQKKHASPDKRLEMSTGFQNARASVGFNKVLIAGRVTSLPRGMALTLNGIAQGIITDKVATIFRDAGALHTLINLGEFRATGSKADGAAWRVGLRDPQSFWRLSGSVSLTTGAVATSAGSGHRMGDAHHLLEPATGQSARYYSSVSVTAPTATLADGLSTALYALPPSKTEDLLENYPGVAARFTLADGQVRMTDGWRNAAL